MTVCAGCGKFGKIVAKPVSRQKMPVQKAPEIVETVVADFAARIRNAREKSGTTQKDFAMRINEKESIVQKLEAGSFVPPISLAKKLEKLLKIQLVEVEQEEKGTSQKGATATLTIGDIISVKK